MWQYLWLQAMELNLFFMPEAIYILDQLIDNNIFSPLRERMPWKLKALPFPLYMENMSVQFYGERLTEKCLYWNQPQL